VSGTASYIEAVFVWFALQNSEHIRCCGNGFLWFRSYSESPFPDAEKVTQKALPRRTARSLKLGVPSLRDRSGRSLPKGQEIKSRIKSHSKSKSQIKRSQPSAAPVGSRASSRPGRLSGRLREQARSHKKQKSKAAQLPAAKPHHSTMSASSSAFDLDPRATSEG